jgi:predicted oxidoreductase
VEGLDNWNPIWSRHGIRIIPGPSSLWLDAAGKRLPMPLLPGHDTLGTLIHLRRTGFDHSWFILTRRIIEKEFALSGSDQNPALVNKSIQVLTSLLSRRIPSTVRAFMDHGADFIVERDVGELARRMNELTGESLIDPAKLRREIEARDAQLDNPFCKDLQIAAVHNARNYFGDRVARTAKPHKLLDPAAGPLIAVRLSIVTRKTLGGLLTDLTGAVLQRDGVRLPGLYAAGEVAGFGGGGMHGYRALEGTFLGGCMFSGRAAARGILEALRD